MNWSGDLFTAAVAGGQYADWIAGHGRDARARLRASARSARARSRRSERCQIRHSVTEDLFWIKGAHSFRFGGSITKNSHRRHACLPGRRHLDLREPRQFPARRADAVLRGRATTTTAARGASSRMARPLLFPTPARIASTWDFTMYAQDDWKMTSNLSLNLGLRYAPTTNPYDATNQTYALLPVPFGPNGDDRQAPSVATPPPSQMTPMRNFFLRNPSLRSFDPRHRARLGSVRHRAGPRSEAATGSSTRCMQCRDYCYGSWFSQPWTVRTVTDPAALTTFPRPFQTPRRDGHEHDVGHESVPDHALDAAVERERPAGDHAEHRASWWRTSGPRGRQPGRAARREPAARER